MTAQEYNIRCEKINELLIILAKGTTIDVNKILDEFGTIYTEHDEFRHEYSQIFATMSRIKQNGESLNNLQENLRGIFDASEGKNEVLRSGLHKLYDHVNLEVNRLDYIDKINDRFLDSQGELSSKIEEANRDASEIQYETGQLRQNLDKKFNEFELKLQTITGEMSSNLSEKFEQTERKLDEKVSDVQKEQITILGLFSAVIIAFMGGIGFSSSVLQSMFQSSIYKIVFVSSLLGIVLMDVLYLLVKFVMVVHRSISDKDKKEIRFLVIITNIALFIIMGLTFGFWCLWGRR